MLILKSLQYLHLLFKNLPVCFVCVHTEFYLILYRIYLEKSLSFRQTFLYLGTEKEPLRKSFEMKDSKS